MSCCWYGWMQNPAETSKQRCGEPAGTLLSLGAMLSQDLLDILVCPACRNPLRYSETAQTLTCTACRRVYPIQDDIPILLVERATIEGA